MPVISTTTREFPHANMWGVSNCTSDVEIGFLKLIHAALTVGHGYGWRKTIGTSLDGKMELLWKLSAFVSTVRCSSVPGLVLPVDQMIQTDRFIQMDPSERRALNYHLGMTMACAWGRKVLGVPWFLHLDVYRDYYGVNVATGQSRPDLIGLHPDGRCVVIECKGYASRPSRNYQDPAKDVIHKAKAQARRVVDIGGTAPDLRLASFSFFEKAPGASRNWPKAVTMLVVDPPEDDEEGMHMHTTELIKLPEWTTDNFFESYYRPWFSFLDSNSKKIKHNSVFVSRDFEDIGIEIGIDPIVSSFPKLLVDPKRADILSERKWPDGFVSGGDGIFIRLDERWTKMFYDQNAERED